MFGLRHRVANLLLIVVGAIVLSTAISAAAQQDWTRCYAGTVTIFANVKQMKPLLSWAENGIIMSNGPNRLLNGAVTHCEGVQRGLGAERTGYGFCKVVDRDGDMIITGGPYSGVTAGSWPLLEGTGKWKGVKGTLRSERIVRSKKGAMPLTYQGCRRERASFELSK
jgi:hypothetical protein